MKMYGKCYLILAVIILFGGSYLAHVAKETWIYLPVVLSIIGGIIVCLIAASVAGMKNIINGNGNGNGKNNNGKLR